MPIVIALRNECLLENHWREIKDLIGRDFDIDDELFTLDALLSLNANEYLDEIQGISTKASAEASLKS